MPIFLGPNAFLIGVEKPNPGNDGTITSKPSSLSPPNFSGWASLSIKCKNSKIDPETKMPVKELHREFKKYHPSFDDRLLNDILQDDASLAYAIRL